MFFYALEAVFVMPGPPPKRSSQRRRRNLPDGVPVTQGFAADDVDVPEADPTWHPIAARWFESLASSGQSDFYEPSDWATAVYVATAMDRNLQSQKGFSAELMKAVMSAMGDLMTTEGARRRARIELMRGDAEAEVPAEVAIMADYRAAAAD